MAYLGDFVEDATVIEFITTHDTSGGAVDPDSALEAADLDWYKDGAAFAPQGITMDSPFVSTGLHKVTIDTSNDGGDDWVTGSDYVAVLTPDETVDGETVIRKVIHFSIENRFNQTVVPPSVAEFEARSLATLDYTVVGDLGTVQSGDSFTKIDAAIDGSNRIDVGSWLGSAVTLSTGNQPDVNIDRIDDVAVSDVATAGKLHVLDDAGDAVANESKQNTIITATGTTLDALIKDVPTVAEFEARSIVSDDYTVVGDLGTVQSGDSYAIVNDGAYGNAKLVRSTTPANTLDILGTGEVAANLTHIMNTILTEDTGGYLAAAFIKLFDVAVPLLVASDVMVGTDGASTHSAANVWAVGDRILTASTNFHDFDPSNDDVAKVTLVATTTVATDAETAITALAAKLLAYFRLALRSDSGPTTDDSTELTALNADSGGGGGNYVAGDSQEGIRDQGDSAWTTVTGRAPAGEYNTQLDANMSTRSSHNAAAVWSASPRTLTANTNLANLEVDLTKILGSALTEGTAGYLAGRFKDFLNVASAAFNVGTALADFKATSVTVSDKTGFKLASDGVDGISAGSGDIKSILDDTHELQGNQGAWATATNFSTHDAAAVKTAIEADGATIYLLAEALINKRIWRESDGRLELHNAAGTSQGTIDAQVATDGLYTTAKRTVIT